MTTKKSTFTIPNCRMDDFKKKMNRLSNKSKKLTPDNPVGFEVTGETVRTFFPIPPAELSGMAAFAYQQNNSFQLSCQVVEVSGLAPVLNGHIFVGTIEHNETGNIVRTSPYLPEGFSTEKYREVKTNCDHCKVNRYRKDTYLVMKKGTEEVLQVGRSCLKDFLGHASPEHYANLCSQLLEVKEEFESESCHYNYNNVAYPITNILALASIFIVKHGFVSRKSEGEVEATANYVDAYIWMDSIQWDKHFGGEKPLPSESDYVLAKKVLAFILEIEKKSKLNDFDYTLLATAKKEHISTKDFGLVTYMVQHYLRDIQKKEDAKHIKPSEFFGEVKQRYNLELVFRRTISFGWCGFSNCAISLYTFNDKDGNIFCWKTTKDFDLEQGEVLCMKGTVKDHTIFGDENIKQTFLTRCQLYEEGEFKAIVEEEEAKTRRKEERRLKKESKEKGE